MALCVRLAVGATHEFRRRAAALDESAPVDSVEVMAYMASTKETAQIAKIAIDAGVVEREAAPLVWDRLIRDRLLERRGDQLGFTFGHDSRATTLSIERAVKGGETRRGSAALNPSDGPVSRPVTHQKAARAGARGRRRWPARCRRGRPL